MASKSETGGELTSPSEDSLESPWLMDKGGMVAEPAIAAALGPAAEEAAATKKLG